MYVNNSPRFGGVFLCLPFETSYICRAEPHRAELFDTSYLCRAEPNVLPRVCYIPRFPATVVRGLLS